MEIPIEEEVPTAGVEQQLAEIWSLVLSVDLERIGRQTSFFELGGDSISSIQLISRCAEIGIHLNTKDIFRYSTLSSMTKLKGNEKKIELLPLKIR